MSFETIRRRLRTQRDAIGKQEAGILSDAVCQQILQSSTYQQAETLAAYLAVGQECSLQAVIEDALACNKTIYLPVVQHESLAFCRWDKQSRMQKSHFGILEPVDTEAAIVEQLGLVLAPLVAFDQHGTRLGMGGGYYDRTFAFLADSTGETNIQLVGVAYEFQRTELPTARPWDIPLDAVVTEAGWQSFSLHRKTP